MEGLSIETSRLADGLGKELRAAVDRLDAGVSAALREERRGEAARFRVSWSDGAGAQAVGREVSRALARHIVANLEPELLAALIRRHYGQFDASERAEILSSARSDAPRRGLVDRLARRIGAYLLAQRTVHLDGFVTFRLKDYTASLEREVDAAVDEFMLDREYREFVRLLHYFVEVQPPKLVEVHVLLQGDGRFEMRDESMQPLPDDVAAEFRLESQGSEINLEDVLVSSLITVAPAQVTVHGDDRAQEMPSVRTARQVFGARLHYCSGCTACEGLRQANV